MSPAAANRLAAALTPSGASMGASAVHLPWAGSSVVSCRSAAEARRPATAAAPSPPLTSLGALAHANLSCYCRS